MGKRGSGRCGLAYYRHSAQDRQENSIPLQRDQVRQWADENDVAVILEFTDAGKPGLNSEGRPAFNEMMDDWFKKRSDFDYVLCLDLTAPYGPQRLLLDEKREPLRELESGNASVSRTSG